MEIEVENEDRSKITVEKREKAVFGRGNGFSTDDRTVSRRHVRFEFRHKSANQTEPSVCFEVLGKNPIWVRRQKDGEVRVFRRSENGAVASGDWFCVSGKRPSWFKVRNIAVGLDTESELDEGLHNGTELEGFDVSEIDPVKEFGFVVMGHEFDHYPKQMVRDVKKWNWFLEEPKKESDDDDELERKGKKGLRRKRKKGEENEDEEWTGESEADEEVAAKLRKVHTPKYSTRSKDRNKPQKGKKEVKISMRKKTLGADEEGLEDEDDETLGGFIVGEEDLEEEELEETDEDEEEEEFVEDEDDEVLDD